MGPSISYRKATGSVVPYDSIPVWAEPPPNDMEAFVAVQFKPTLEIVNGSQPYPAVDEFGNTSGGLRPTGRPSGGCDDTTKAQVYARTGFYDGVYAIMYAWYMPKDSPSTLMGHRHEWEHTVVWLTSNNPATATIIAASTSAHGKYKKSYPMNPNYVADDGFAVQINYKSTWPKNHETGFTTKTAGVKQPLIQWEQLTEAARNALETADFGAATVPFKSNFEANLAKAYVR